MEGMAFSGLIAECDEGVEPLPQIGLG
jgi:hypothetical protein